MMSTLILFLLLGVSEQAQTAPAQNRTALRQYFSTSDYPPEALRLRQEGDVRFRVEIDTQGRVTGCQVLKSSGSASLDETTCRLATSRLTFTPAKDQHGDPIADHFETTVRWRLQDSAAPAPPSSNLNSVITASDYPASALRRGEQGRVVFALTVSAQGLPTGCEVTVSSGSETLDARTCELLLQRARFTPARDSAGNPIDTVVTDAVNWTISADPVFEYAPDETPGPRPARPVRPIREFITESDYPMRALWRNEQGRVGVELQVSADGRATGCRFIDRSASRLLDDLTCQLLVRRARFHPARNAQNENIAATWRGHYDWRLPF